MLLVFLFLLLILLGLIFSNVNITLTKINANIKDFDFNINISLFWFKFLKVFNMRLNKKSFSIFGKEIKYSKIFSKNQMDKLRKEMKLVKLKDLLKIIKELEVDLSEAIFNLNVGVNDMTLTIILVVIISMFSTIFVQNKKTRKVRYQILPEFNKFEITFKGKLNFKIKTNQVLKLFYKHILLKNRGIKTSESSSKYISI